MKVFELPGEGPAYRVTITADGLRSLGVDQARPVYAWRIDDADGRLVSLGAAMTLAGEVGADHDLDDAWRRLALGLAHDSEVLARGDTATSVYYRWIRSEREFLTATWERWALVKNPQEQVAKG